MKHSACLGWRRLRNIFGAESKSVSFASVETKSRMLTRRRTNRRMKILNAGRLVFWVATILATGFLVRAETGQKRASMPDRKNAPPMRIFDQNGRPAVSGAPSVTSQIVDVTVGPDLAFHPDTVNISVGDTVRWTWAGSGHSVTSGPPCAADSQYCSPDDMNCAAGILSNNGTVYMHTFAIAPPTVWLA
jgi:plastocyanin